jgi:molybdopterin molybdotransferase
MLQPQDAERLILNQVTPFDAQQDLEWVPLAQAHRRILAQPIRSQLDFPHWDNSAMDGYAVRHQDVDGCHPDRPVSLQVIEEIPAGYQPQRHLQPGQAARIFTGAVLPAGADTIVIQEQTQRQDDRVTILHAPQPGAFIRQQGAYYRAGEVLLSPGLGLAAPEMAILAAAQILQVPVYRQVRVAILSTGNELVPPEQSLQPGQLVDSNHYALAALVETMGAIAIPMGIVPDQRQVLQSTIATAINQADVVLSSGGVSVGEYDYVDQVLSELGATLHIRTIAVKPGKPFTFATWPSSQSYTLYFGLPGNPVSALVSFWRFVQPALRRRSGQAGPWSTPLLSAHSQAELRSDGQRETYIWGQLKLNQGHYEFHPATGSFLSGNLINLAGTTGLAVLPMGQTVIPANECVQVLAIAPPV